MIGRIIFLLLAVVVLAALLYMQEPESGNSTATPAQTAAAEPGFVALGAQIIETGDNGQPLYTLDAQRIAQPVPDGIIYLTAPVLHYEPAGANPWVLTAQQGQLPQSAQNADLSGMVNASGTPQGSQRMIRFRTSTLHVDMQKQLATTAAVVHIDWGGSLVSGHGMHADLKSGEVKLFHAVSGAIVR
ncbi:MAG TPA: LPS export ABC transporter periplasmic protein LptC [Steroidobacteraceae bacterium]|nr:LPS export ABC transporter periplasmic protein LptC [Steroidobacteraceae bacterium]